MEETAVVEVHLGNKSDQYGTRLTNGLYSDPSNIFDFLNIFGGNVQSKLVEPEKELMRALLEDALNLIHKNKNSKHKIGINSFNEAYSWVFEKGDPDYLYSFENVCSTIDLDPDYIRKGVKLSLSQKVKSA